MYQEIISSRTKVSLRSHTGCSMGSRGSEDTTYTASKSWRCSCILCVVVASVVVTLIGSLITVPLVRGFWTLSSTQVVSVESTVEQQRLILIAKQNCFRLSEQREHEKQNGTAPIVGACGVEWDDILCWDLAPAGTNVTQSCPNYINRFNKNAIATKHCTENGTWWFNPEVNKTWSNYTQCMRPPIDLNFHSAHGDRIRLLYTVGYSVSLGTLLIAVIIMLSCKRLHSKSNTLHINLFLAFILRAITSFLKDLLFVGNVGLAKDVRVDKYGILAFLDDSSHWECKTLIVLFMYSVSACNMWILAEALYLTMLVHRTLVTERQGVKAYIILGWMLPLICLIPWIVVKAVLEDTYCWNIQHNSTFYWIHRGPSVSVIVINLFLFLNIFRKLFLKIRHSSELGSSCRAKYRKLAKFILVLIPLFGVMYIVFYVVVPSSFQDNSFNVSYLYLEMAYNSFQGFVLALLFCFLNEEVHGELKRVWYRHKYQKGDTAAFTRSFAATSYRRSLTASTSRCHSPAPVPQVPMKDFRQESRLKSTHSSSQELVRYPELLTAAEKRNLRLHKAHSHDLEQHPLHDGERVGNGLLKRAIKGSAAQNSCQRKQSNTDSVSSDERLLLTLT